MRKAEKFEVDGKTYVLQFWSFDKAVEMAAKLGKICGGPLTAAAAVFTGGFNSEVDFSKLEKAVTDLFQNIEPAKLKELTTELTEGLLIENESGVQVPVDKNRDFDCNLFHGLKVLKEVALKQLNFLPGLAAATPESTAKAKVRVQAR